MEIKVFDAGGKQLNKYSKKDLYVQSGGEGLVADGKDYYFSVNAPAYPVTAEFNYSIVSKGTYHYENYYIQFPDQSVQKSSFNVKIPRDLDIRYRPMYTVLQPQIDESDKKLKGYTWTTTDLPVKKYEEGSGSMLNNFPWISIAPNKFELDGYPGEMNTWKNLGMWYNTLVKDDNLLSPESKREIQQLAASGKTDREKIQIVYNFLQKNCRYVSIQLGIGGLKPFSADFVHKKKYGDCKALSNYMQACLQALNIKSYSAWVTGSSSNPTQVEDDFPSDPFNHQILCVQLEKDTIWLECTSPTTDFGVLGNFTENRKALVLTETGGVLVNTPASNAAENLFSSNSIIKLDESGSGIVDAKLNGTGEYKQTFINYIGEEKKDDQKRFLVYYLGFMQPDIFDLKYDKTKRDAVSVEMEYEKIYDFKAGSKFFLNPRIYKLWSYSLPSAESRKNDFFFDCPFVKTDTTVYQLPANFQVETLPKPKNISCEFGTFSSNYIFDEATRTITSIAKLTLNHHRIPAAKYSATKEFFDDVLTEYTEKIVVKRN